MATGWRFRTGIGRTGTADTHAAWQAGITLWDTADVYGAGDSEQRIGDWRQRTGQPVTVITKVGRSPALYPSGYSRTTVRASLEGSARRLGVETLDLAQLHCVPFEVLRDGEIFTWLDDLRQEGLIRHFNRDGQAFNVGETFSGLPFETAVGLVDELRDILPPDQAMAQLALRWILDHPAVSTVIAGVSRPEQVAVNASASALAPLPGPLHARLRDFYVARVRDQVRGGI